MTTLPSGVTETYGYSNANRSPRSPMPKVRTSARSPTDTTIRPMVHRVRHMGTDELPTATTDAVYDAANQISSSNGTANTHDANGNVTAAGPQTFTWKPGSS